MQVRFQNGTTLDVLVVSGKSVYIQGANRDALEIQLAMGSVTIGALDMLTANSSKTSKLTLIDGDQQYVHDNYVIRAELAIKPIVTMPATGTDPEITENRLCVTLAQLTYLEVTQKSQQSMIDLLTLSELEG